MSNEWSTLIGLFSVFYIEQPDHIPLVNEVLSLTNLVMAKVEGNDWYYVRARANNKIIEDIPNKVDGWKTQFWWVFGDWRSPMGEFGSTDRIKVETEFGFY